MNINKNFYKMHVLILLFIVFFVPQAHAQDVKKIVIMPFEIFSNRDHSSIRELLYRALSDELKKERSVQVIPSDELLKNFVKVIEGKAVSYGKSKGADFVMIGTLTQFGESLNIDAKVIDVETQKVISTISENAKGWDNLGSMVTQINREILSDVGLIQKIARIDVQGNRKISSSAIITKIKSKAGGNFSETDVTADIKTIFKMGFFLDVKAQSSSSPEGMVLTFVVQEKGLISEIVINGNKVLSKDDIREVLAIQEKQNLNQEQIKAGIEKIKALYDNKGYFNAEIKDRVEQDGEKDFRVILDIKENAKLYVRAIHFEGNEAYSAKELRNMMSTSEKGFFSFITDSGLLKHDQLKQDVGKINAFYFNNGFINAQIAEPKISTDAKGIYIFIRINEGKRFKIDQVQISGDSLEKSREELFGSLKVKKGDNYNREAIIKDLDFLTQVCNDEGYANADVEPRVNIRENEQLVDLDFQIRKGDPVYFGYINIFGNTITRDKVIRRQLAVVEGDLYSSSNLRKSYANLNRLQYFEEIDFQTEKGSDANKMDVNIRVKEKSTGMFMIGAGYSAADQAIFMAQVTQQNFLGYGQVLSLKASLGSSTTNFDLSFTEPWLFDLPLWSKVDAWKYKKEYDSYSLDSRGGGLTLGYPVWEKIVGYIGYKLAFDDIGDVLATAPPEIKAIQGETISSNLTVSLMRDTTDDYIFPSRGAKVSVGVTQSGGFLGGDTNFTQYSGNVFTYFPLPLGIVFSAKGRIGYIQEHDGVEAPPYYRYVLGGMNTLRGFRYVGPTNPGTSDVIGGTSMLIFNFELIFPFIKESGMKIAAFYDAGNSWNNSMYIDDLRQSVGLGLRWYSPLGPLRLEYGHIIDGRGIPSDSSGRWEFTIGMPM